MAKVKGPLFSMAASGKLADSLVYMTWKGIDDVRSWVKPANPKTAAQQSQRTKLTNAVAEFHSAGFTSADKSAFNLRATLEPSPLSGFNYFVKEHIKAAIEGKTWYSLYNCVKGTPSGGSITITVQCSADKGAKLYLGTSKTSQPVECSGTYASSTWTFELTGLSAGVTYYFYIKNTATGAAGTTGLFYFIAA